VLGPGLDVRGDGGYVVAPPSTHPNGNRYAFIKDSELAEMPEWLLGLLGAPSPRQPTSNSEGTAKIREGQRNSSLTSLAGGMRQKGLSQSAIEAALLVENQKRCEPPLPESEVLRIAKSVGRYPPGTAMGLDNPWAAAETLDEFLAAEDEEPDALYQSIVYPGTITEIFSPRGIGKSLVLAHVFAKLKCDGKRVFLIDRDNPRHVVKARLRAWGIEGTDKSSRVITREKCPPLTNAHKWASFPYNDYDVVLLDSFDSMAEGVGEQDSAKPSRAIGPILDIAHRENGPGVLVLGNCVRTGAHSRGSGVVEDRADIVYEVRDVTDFHPSGKKNWWEELPPADAGSWALRSSRRKQRQKYRLAFICTKFRIGEEPEPFVLEIDTTTEPWTLRNVTDDVDREGAAERARRAKEKAETIAKAAKALANEVHRRHEAGEPPMLKDRDAVPLVVGLGLTRSLARHVVNNPDGQWILREPPAAKGHPVVLFPPDAESPGKEDDGGGKTTSMKGAKTQAGNKADFRPPHEQATAEMDLSHARINSGPEKARISAAADPHPSPPPQANLDFPAERRSDGEGGEPEDGEAVRI
jgi:hypothetical protein